MLNWENLNKIAIAINLIQIPIWCGQGFYWIWKNRKTLSENISWTWSFLKPTLIFLLDIIAVIIISGIPWPLLPTIMVSIFELLRDNFTPSLSNMASLFLSIYSIWIFPVALPVIFFPNKEKALTYASIFTGIGGVIQIIFILPLLPNATILHKISLFLVSLLGFPIFGNLIARFSWFVKQEYIRQGRLQFIKPVS